MKKFMYVMMIAAGVALLGSCSSDVVFNDVEDVSLANEKPPFDPPVFDPFDPDGPGGGGGGDNPGDPGNYPTWYAHPAAQAFYTSITGTDKYKYDAEYAKGVDQSWSALVKRMKPYDVAETTQSMCQMWINSTYPKADGSYRQGYIDGVKTAIDAYNANLAKGNILVLDKMIDLSMIYILVR